MTRGRGVNISGRPVGYFLNGPYLSYEMEVDVSNDQITRLCINYYHDDFDDTLSLVKIDHLLLVLIESFKEDSKI